MRPTSAGAVRVGEYEPCFVFEVLAVRAPSRDDRLRGNDNSFQNEKTRGQNERIDRKKEKAPPDSRTGVVGLHVAFHTESPSKPCAVPVRGLDWEHALDIGSILSIILAASLLILEAIIVSP